MIGGVWVDLQGRETPQAWLLFRITSLSDWKAPFVGHIKWLLPLRLDSESHETIGRILSTENREWEVGQFLSPSGVCLLLQY